MIRYSLYLLATGLLFLWLQASATDPRRRLQESHQEAVRLLSQAADAWGAGHRRQASQLLASAARRISELSRAGKELIPPAERTRFKRLSEDLRGLSHRLADDQKDLLLNSHLAVLKEMGSYFQEPASELDFRTTYAGSRTIEQGGRGHASVMGPAPPQRSSSEDIREMEGQTTAVLDFEEMPVIKEKNYSGGPDKDHILESGGGGVALFDYDNDGLLDIYIVNSFELTPDRKRIPHRNRL